MDESLEKLKVMAKLGDVTSQCAITNGDLAINIYAFIEENVGNNKKMYMLKKFLEQGLEYI